jgi:hypothetical protein
MEGNNWKVTEGNYFLFIYHGHGCFSKHLFFGYSNLRHDFFFYFRTLLWIGLPTFFILDKLLAPFGSMLDEIVLPFGVKKEGKINKKKGKTS